MAYDDALATSAAVVVYDDDDDSSVYVYIPLILGLVSFCSILKRECYLLENIIVRTTTTSGSSSS